jgi:hypothetical protein
LPSPCALFPAASLSTAEVHTLSSNFAIALLAPSRERHHPHRHLGTLSSSCAAFLRLTRQKLDFFWRNPFAGYGLVQPMPFF